MTTYDNNITVDEEWELIRAGDNEGPFKSPEWEIFRKEMVWASALAEDKAWG